MLTILAIITITITSPVPTDADLAYMGALLCGEACGMPQGAMQLVADNIAFNYTEHGTHWLRTRWYAPLRSNDAATEMMRKTLMRATLEGQGSPYLWCRLVGSKADKAYWLEHGYVEAEPDFTWSVRELEVNAYDCRWRMPVVRRWECEGDGCPQ